MKFTPREYQKIAVEFILRQHRCAVWAAPGMGKTATIYTVLDILKIAGSSFFPVLIIAPKKVAGQVWPFEVHKWDEFKGITVTPILGTVKEREEALLSRTDVYVINYDNIQWLIDRLGERWPFKIVVADESTKLKNFRMNQGGKRSQALSKIAAKTGRWINLTGTPAPNGLKDLWGQTWFLDQGERLGKTYTAFQDRWFTTNAYTRETVPRGGASPEIHKAIGDITIALRPEDWFDIKQPLMFERPVELPDAARKLYDEMEKQFFIEIGDKEIDALNAAALSMKLLQLASGSVYDGARTPHPVHDAKIEALESLVNELGGEPLLVCYHFKFEPAMIQKAFPQARIFRTKQDEDDWNAGRIPLMLIHPASGGHGVNLQQGGRAMAFFTNNWDLELRMQVIERIGPTRQAQAGFDRAVLIYDIIANNTLDSAVLARLNGKRTVQDALMAARARKR